jgi:hypothetical protein
MTQRDILMPRDFPGIVPRTGTWPVESVVSKFGQFEGLTGPDDIWPLGGTYNWPTPALTAAVDVVSSDVNDSSSSGSGAHTVTVEGLDADFNPQSELFSMNGTTTVVGSAVFSRVFRVYVSSCGTYGGNNEGAISVKATGGGNTLGYILAEKGQSQQAMYTIPAGHTGYVRSVRMHVSGSRVGVTMEMFQRQNADDNSGTVSAKRLVSSWFDIIGHSVLDYGWGLPFPEKTDIWFTGTRVGTASIPDACVEFSVYLIPS